jgi:hypothetical protein
MISMSREAEESAPENRTERPRRLGLVRERRVVESQAAPSLPEVGIFVAVDG